MPTYGSSPASTHSSTTPSFGLKQPTSGPEPPLSLPIQQPLLIKPESERSQHHRQLQHQHSYHHTQQQQQPHNLHHSHIFHQHSPDIRTHTPTLPSPSSYQDPHRSSSSQHQTAIDHTRYYQKVCTDFTCSLLPIFRFCFARSTQNRVIDAVY